MALKIDPRRKAALVVKVKELKAQGLGLDEIAEKLGVSRSSAMRWSALKPDRQPRPLIVEIDKPPKAKRQFLVSVLEIGAGSSESQVSIRVSGQSARQALCHATEQLS